MELRDEAISLCREKRSSEQFSSRGLHEMVRAFGDLRGRVPIASGKSADVTGIPRGLSGIEKGDRFEASDADIRRFLGFGGILEARYEGILRELGHVDVDVREQVRESIQVLAVRHPSQRGPPDDRSALGAPRALGVTAEPRGSDAQQDCRRAKAPQMPCHDTTVARCSSCVRALSLIHISEPTRPY